MFLSWIFICWKILFIAYYYINIIKYMMIIVEWRSYQVWSQSVCWNRLVLGIFTSDRADQSDLISNWLLLIVDLSISTCNFCDRLLFFYGVCIFQIFFEFWKEFLGWAIANLQDFSCLIYYNSLLLLFYIYWLLLNLQA